MLDGHDDVSTKVNKVSRGNSQSTRAFADTVTRGVDGKHYKKRVIRVKIDICHLSLVGSAEIRSKPVQHCHRLVRQSDIGDCYWLSLFHRRLNDKSIGLR
jgi:hypothetical protein